MTLLAVFVLVCVHATLAEEALGRFNCASMKPTFTQGNAQTRRSPYDVSVHVEPCENQVTLNGTVEFIGFLCQARRVPTGIPPTSGTITQIGSGMTNDCLGMTSINHDSTDEKKAIQFTWEPRADETVKIVCTVVKDRNTFWMRQQSEIVDIDTDACTTTTADPTTTAPRTTTTESSSAKPVAPAMSVGMLLVILVLGVIASK